MVRSSFVQSCATALALFSLITGCDQPQAVDPGNRPGADRFLVSITPERDSVLVGDALALTATVRDALGAARTDQVVRWSSLAPDIASVDGVGLVTGVAAGTAPVVALVGLGGQAHADTAVILVQAKSLALSIAPELAEITLGDTLRLEANFSSPSGADVRGVAIQWQTSDPTVAAISGDGMVISRDTGDVTFTATGGGATARALARVLPNPARSVSVTPANSGLNPGDAAQMVATIRDARGRIMPRVGVRWSSSDPAVASVNPEGVVRGRSRGAAIITATTDNSAKASASVNVFAVPAADVVVTAPSNSVTLGGRLQAVATARDAEGTVLTGKAVAWSSSNPSVAQVGATGLITGLTVGNTNIHAIIDGKFGTLPISVINATPSTLAIVPGTATVSLGKTAQLTAELRDQAGNIIPGQTVIWSSADAGVATVTSNGAVNAVGAGTARISATAGTLSAQATITVVPASVASVSVAPATSQVQIGSTQQLNATVTSANGPVSNPAISWSSSNPAVVTVSVLGLATGISAGNATITATSSGSSGSANVVVSAPAALPITSVTVTFNSPTLLAGQSTQATAVARDANGIIVTGHPVLWVSSDAPLASVSPSGLVTAIAGGSATIVAKIDGVVGYATLSIGAPAPLPVHTVQLTVAPSTINTGRTAVSNVVLRDSLGGTLSGHTVGYSSSRPNVASVGLGGVITGVSAGGAVITASSGGKSGSVPMTVVSAALPSVATVTVTANATTLVPGQVTQALATARDSAGSVIAGQTVSWLSSNPAAASVSGTGLLAGIAAGATTITATVGGKSGSVVITVSSVATASVTVSSQSSSVTVGQFVQATAMAKDASGNALPTKPIFWSSSSAAVASVSMNGLITGVSVGTATITASSEGKSGTLSITVTAAAASGPVPSIAPTLPQAVPSTAWPAITRTLTVNAGGNLQAALDSAKRGDEIVIAAGATFTGNFLAKPKGGTGDILVRSSALAQLPPLGTRVDPAQHAQYMPKIVTPNNTYAITVLPGASGWRFVGLEVTGIPNYTTWVQYRLFGVGSGSGLGDPVQNTLALAPQDVVLDRLYVHGQPNVNSAGCIVFNSGATAIIDSWVSECHGKGLDAQAIANWNGQGPFLIENNRLEASGEVIMFGGSDPRMPNAVASDITIRRNYLTRPMSWQGVWTVKNLFELKNAQRVLFEANVLENNWVDGQAGSAVVLATVNQNGSCTWCVVQDVTVQYNHIHNSAAGFNVFARCGPVSGVYGCNQPGLQAIATRRVKIANNLLTNIGVAGLGAAGSVARVFLLQSNVDDLWVEYNTGFAPYSFVTLECTGGLTRARFTFRGNIGGGSQYDWFSAAGQGDAASAACLTQPYLVANNGFVAGATAQLPTGSLRVATLSAAGFVNPTAFGNWSLTSTSPFITAGPGGAAAGVNYTTLAAKLAGVK